MFALMFRLKPVRRLSVCFKEKSVWTSEKVCVSPYKDVDIPNMTVDQYVFKDLEKWANKTAVVSRKAN